METQKRKVECRGSELEYYLTRKRVKNINMRVKPDGSVCVSAASGVSVKYIDEFVSSKYDFITRSIEKLKEESKASAAEPDLDALHSEGDIFPYLGKNYTLRFSSGADDDVHIEVNELIVMTLGEDRRYSAKLLRNWYYNRTVELFRRLNAETCAMFREKYDVPEAKIKIKYLRSMWGECFTRKGTIVMNSRLIYYPEEAVKSVFVHEYAHFIVPDHSARFYAVVNGFMPEYRKFHRMLK